MFGLWNFSNMYNFCCTNKFEVDEESFIKKMLNGSDNDKPHI